MFSVDKLTMGEIAKIEELSGQAISAIGDEDAPKGKALAAMAYVVHRRKVPAFTWNEALGLTFAEANEILGLGETTADATEAEAEDATEEVDPTEPLPEPTPLRKPRKPKPSA